LYILSSGFWMKLKLMFTKSLKVNKIWLIDNNDWFGRLNIQTKFYGFRLFEGRHIRSFDRVLCFFHMGFDMSHPHTHYLRTDDLSLPQNWWHVTNPRIYLMSHPQNWCIIHSLPNWRHVTNLRTKSHATPCWTNHMSSPPPSTPGLMTCRSPQNWPYPLYLITCHTPLELM